MARIRPRTEVKSGPSTVSGSGAAPIIGSGAPQASLSSLSGSGSRILTASGTPQAQDSTVSGSQSLTNAVRIDALLSSYTIPFTVNYPADPVTTRQVSVSTASAFNTEAAVSGTEITITSSFSGNITIAANDIDVIATGATVTGSIGATGRSRIRWTGGTINSHAAGIQSSTWRNVSDVLFDNAVLFTRFEMHRQSGVGGNSRAAMINTTTDMSGSLDNEDIGQHWIFDGVQRHSDVIYANYVGRAADNSPLRLQGIDRVVIAGSLLNPDARPASGLRVHQQSDSLHVVDTTIVSRKNLSLIEATDQIDVTNATWHDVRSYHIAGVGAATFSLSDSRNTGVVSYSALAADDRAYTSDPNIAGNSMSISPFTGTVPTINSTAWDGQPLDETGFGADH